MRQRRWSVAGMGDILFIVGTIECFDLFDRFNSIRSC